MAVLERTGTRLRAPLLTRHLVGRSNLAQLRLSDSSVSSEHAMISWDGQAWQVQDLGSKNGTLVDRRRLASGESVTLHRGSVLTFGSASNRWSLTDDSPPRAMALPRNGGAPVEGEQDLVAVPDVEAPEVCVYRDAAGEWVLDRDGALEHIADGSEVVAGGRRFTLHLPEAWANTWEEGEARLSIEQLTLSFRVSEDSGYIELAVGAEGRSVDLGARVHHALLLELAYLRLEDQQQAPGEEDAHGWIYKAELARRLELDEPELNVAIYRCRQQLAAEGIVGAAGIIERRPLNRQLRLGVGSIEISSL